MKNRMTALLFCCAISCYSSAQETPGASDLINPDRPGIADGSNVIGSHHFQVEVGFQSERHDETGVRDKRFFLPTLLRFGATDRLEFRLETAGLYTASEVMGDRNAGSSPFSAGAKLHLQDADGLKRPSVGVIARVFPPSGSSVFRSDRLQADLRLAADQDLAPNSVWSLNPNIGIGMYDAGDGTSFVTGLFAATLGYNPTPRLNFFIDAGIQSPEEKGGKAGTIVDIGTAVIIGQNTQLDLSFGTGIGGHTVPHPFLALGISRRL